MFKRTLTAALVIPTIVFSGAAYAGGYVGGPKSSIPMTTAAPTFETKKPYAQYVPNDRARTNRHIYQGGPRTGVPHGR